MYPELVDVDRTTSAQVLRGVDDECGATLTACGAHRRQIDTRAVAPVGGRERT
jgi:hypothetical protein|tara:strand:+ start:430 stop:588 length:159 start_codon:yes stop_codon:yes gene_type:complete